MNKKQFHIRLLQKMAASLLSPPSRNSLSLSKSVASSGFGIVVVVVVVIVVVVVVLVVAMERRLAGSWLLPAIANISLCHEYQLSSWLGTRLPADAMTFGLGQRMKRKGRGGGEEEDRRGE